MLDVIVLTVDRTNLLPLYETLKDVEHRGIVVDNSGLGVREGIFPDPWLRLHGSRDLNYSQSLNYALSYTKAENLTLFISDDARPRPGAIQAMCDHDHELVSTINVSSNGLVNHAGMYFHEDHPQHVGRGWTLDQVPAECQTYAIATFACMMVEPDVLHDVGEFDERYQWSHEEVDYILRARECGYPWPLVCSRAVVDHDEKAVKDTPRRARANIEYYKQKWLESGRLAALA